MVHKDLLFGTAGVPHSSAKGTTVEGIRRVRELGLDCMEIEFVRGGDMERRAAGLGNARAAADIVDECLDLVLRTRSRA